MSIQNVWASLEFSSQGLSEQKIFKTSAVQNIVGKFWKPNGWCGWAYTYILLCMRYNALSLPLNNFFRKLIGNQ